MQRRLILSSLTALIGVAGATRATVQAPQGPSGTAAHSAPAAKQTRLEIKDGWYYLDGRRIFLNALGYEFARPGQHPYEQPMSPDPARLRVDLAAIKAAGFNAIRTWQEQLGERELEIVRESGLLVLYGIWVPPDEDFSDPQVIARDEALVRRVLSYSRRFDNIVTYLIMNEPMPEHIHRVGAQATVDLWKRLRDIIHQEHPGIPVTITGNATILSFADMNLFDVYAYNVYDYDDNANFTHGFANGIRSLAEMNAQGKPLVITEFGRSVSRAGGDHYGGKTLKQQSDELLRDYRGLLDSGASGACPFYWADGWWKGGNPSRHDDTPEEWFGFWGYADLQDQVGYPRPVWHALRTYNQAIVASPRNGAFYQNEVPLEIFLQDDVSELRVVERDRIILRQAKLSGGDFSSVLSYAGEPLADRELVFEFYDAAGKLLKLETVVILTGKDPVVWPTLELQTPTKDLAEGEVAIDITVRNDTGFTLGDSLRYVFAPHLGWERGEKRRASLDRGKKEQVVHDVYRVPDRSQVLGLFAGADVRHGKFVRTIYAQQLLYRGDWADPIRRH